MDETDTTWFAQEVSCCHLADERLKKRWGIYWAGLEVRWAKLFAEPARTGLTPGRPIGFFQTTG